MELWIRSQDKRKLIKSNEITICDDAIIETIKFIGEDRAETIEKPQQYMIIVGSLNVGTYKSKERALEVLDEIQNKLLKSKYDKASENYGKHSDCKDTLIEISSSTYVYQMPSE